MEKLKHKLTHVLKYGQITRSFCAFQERPRMMPVMTVRHGRSTNNVLLDNLCQKMDNKEITFEEFEKLWVQNRSDDPDLTSVGKEEAESLSKWLKSSNITDTKHLFIFCSPFKRTLDTTYGLTSHLSKKDYTVMVHPDIYETGGCWTRGSNDERSGPGSCFTAKQISDRFHYDVSMLNQNGGWYQGGWENDLHAMKRARRVVKWIKSGEMKNLVHNNYEERKRREGGQEKEFMCIMVMHAHFINQVTKELLVINDDKSLFSSKYNSFHEQHVNFRTENTATSLFNIADDGKVIVQWISSAEHLGHSAEYLLSKM
jgi:broad specificity phosphatase PhoE